MMNRIKQQIHDLVRKYEKNKEYYRSAGFNETQVRNEFLDPLFEILGWDIRNSAGMATYEREVLLEEPLKSSAAVHTKKPDYTFRLYGERKFFLEAKKPCVRIDENNEPAKQVRRYGFTAGLKISVLSNFENLYIYDTTCPVKDGDSLTKSRIKSYHYTDYENSAEELLRLLGKESVYSGQFDEEWKDIEINIEHTPVDKLFLAQINQWRLMLGRQIRSLQPDIDIDRLGDVVQSYINKILFLRVCEDRNIETYQMLLSIADHKSQEELIAKFQEADRRYNSGLFAAHLSDSIIYDMGSSFWTIIHQLYFPESPYSFSVLSSDMLGRIYEIFLAQRLEIVDNELLILNKPENMERDIVTTPNYIICEILRQTVAELVAGKNDIQINSLKCADIACGSGAFLLELYQYLYDSLLDYYLAHDRTKLIQTGPETYKLPFVIKRNLLTNCIFGVDKDYNAVESCKFGLLLKLLEDEDVNTLSEFRPILPGLDENIFFGNSLLSPEYVVSELVEEINPFSFDERRFDLIVGNPPYMKTEDIKKITPNEKKLYEQRGLYTSAYKQYDKYYLFIERAMGLLKPDGYLGYIVPSKFMKVGAASKLRELISRGRYLNTLISFGAHQVFEDKSTYTCIIIIRNKAQNTFRYSEVEDFPAWRTHSKDTNVFCNRGAGTISGDTWILCTDAHKPLLDAVTKNSLPLESIVGDDHIFNGIQTSANQVYVFVPHEQDETTYTFDAFNGKTYRIEKTVTKPYFKTVQGTDSLNTYRTFAPNARVIFPYERNTMGHLSLIPLSILKSKYPLLYSFLIDAKSELNRPSRDIQPKTSSSDEWYRYGRHQSLEACEVPEKIIVGVLAQAEKYAVDEAGTLVSSGGTAGYCIVSVPPGCHYSIYYIQALLGSVQGEWLASLYGEIFRGGYIARGTKVLKQIPLHVINFDDPDDVARHDDIVARQKNLIMLGDKMFAANGNRRKLIPLQRRFCTLKQEQQNAINALYGMTEEEVLQIPIIKELYAAD